MSTRGHDTSDPLDLDNCNLDFKNLQQPVYSSIQIPHLAKSPSSGQYSMVCACYIFNPQKCNHVCCAYRVFTKRSHATNSFQSRIARLSWLKIGSIARFSQLPFYLQTYTRTQITAPVVCSYSNGFSKRSAFSKTHANIRLYGTSDKRSTRWWIFCEVNSVFVNSK